MTDRPLSACMRLATLVAAALRASVAKGRGGRVAGLARRDDRLLADTGLRRVASPGGDRLILEDGPVIVEAARLAPLPREGPAGGR